MRYFEKQAKISYFKKLKNQKVRLSPKERSLVLKRKAVWNMSSLNGQSREVPAVWKSVDQKTGKITYVTNTHRAFNTSPSLIGAINRFHNFIKSTA